MLVGADRAGRLGLPGPDVIDTRSRLYPDTERVMGWDIGGSGWVALSASVADIVEAHLGDDVRGFLAGHGLSLADVRRRLPILAGPRVLEATARALDLPASELGVTWQSLAEVGNLSSASVLHVLSRTMEKSPPDPGSAGVLFAMGPGFCSELVLLRWPS